MKTALVALAFALALALPASARPAASAAPAQSPPQAPAMQAPEMYRLVASVHWVVRDLEAVKRAWARLGFPAREDFGDVPLAVTLRGQARQARLRVAMTRLPKLTVYWIQPLDGASAFGEFLARHGEGIFSLNHRAPSLAALDAEVARLRGLGVAVLQRSEVSTDEGTLTVVHMDTAEAGGFTVGLVHGSAPGDDASPATPPFPGRLAQFAFVVRDLDAAGAFWNKVGLPAMERTHPLISERMYHGRPAAFDQELGWHRHGTVTYEWIRSTAGPTIYDDFLQAHGPGLHHIAFEVGDLDAALALWKAAGFEAVQSGAWGEKGKPGSGRYAYVDTERAGGVFVELLWNLR